MLLESNEEIIDQSIIDGYLIKSVAMIEDLYYP
jgi:hypothetical protein